MFVISSDASLETLKFSKNVMSFSKYGISMLSSVLNSPHAIQVNIQVVFEAIRYLIEVEEKPKRKIGFIARERQAAYRTSGKHGISSRKTRSPAGPSSGDFMGCNNSLNISESIESSF